MEAYPAKLTGSPPHLHRKPPSPTQDPPVQPMTIPPNPLPLSSLQPQLPPQPQPIPIHLPNIYVNPYPPVPSAPAQPSLPPPRALSPPSPPRTKVFPPPPPPPTPTSPMRKDKDMSMDDNHWSRWRRRRPHPLLWLTMAISLFLLVLQVPKGSLPTFTGRHRALRAQEKLVQERLALVNQLATFLPPPLSSLVGTLESSTSTHTSPFSHLSPLDRQRLDALRLGTGLRFWSSNGAILGTNGGGDDTWWSIEDLGEGASVVRSKGFGKEREVWVLRTDGDVSKETGPLLQSFTHSLLLRERLQSELNACRATPCPVCSTTPALLATAIPHPVDLVGSGRGEDGEEWRKEWDRLEDWRRREKERELEVEEREREVGRREKWVVEEMRKLSDKVHAQATELTLEDRITERLKAYQRQLAHLTEEGLD